MIKFISWGCYFQRDWNDGTVLCKLVRSLGGPIPGYDQLTSDHSSWETNLNKGTCTSGLLGSYYN
jgi:hypothetical protein